MNIISVENKVKSTKDQRILEDLLSVLQCKDKISELFKDSNHLNKIDILLVMMNDRDVFKIGEYYNNYREFNKVNGEFVIELTFDLTTLKDTTRNNFIQFVNTLLQRESIVCVKFQSCKFIDVVSWLNMIPDNTHVRYVEFNRSSINIDLSKIPKYIEEIYCINIDEVQCTKSDISAISKCRVYLCGLAKSAGKDYSIRNDYKEAIAIVDGNLCIVNLRREGIDHFDVLRYINGLEYIDIDVSGIVEIYRDYCLLMSLFSGKNFGHIEEIDGKINFVPFDIVTSFWGSTNIDDLFGIIETRSDKWNSYVAKKVLDSKKVLDFVGVNILSNNLFEVNDKNFDNFHKVIPYFMKRTSCNEIQVTVDCPFNNAIFKNETVEGFGCNTNGKIVVFKFEKYMSVYVQNCVFKEDKCSLQIVVSDNVVKLVFKDLENDLCIERNSGSFVDFISEIQRWNDFLLNQVVKVGSESMKSDNSNKGKLSDNKNNNDLSKDNLNKNKVSNYASQTICELLDFASQTTPIDDGLLSGSSLKDNSNKGKVLNYAFQNISLVCAGQVNKGKVSIMHHKLHCQLTMVKRHY